MEKRTHSQLELFSQTKNSDDIITSSQHSFFNYVRYYEKFILIIVVFMITAIISFSLGVEKGKSITTLKSQPRFDFASSIKQPKLMIPLNVPATINMRNKANTEIKKEEVIHSPEIKVREYMVNYTIQVASFQNKTSAQKEMGALKRKGFSVSLVSKGRYQVVYVGNFSQKEDARTLLAQLKRRYQDCFIRRL